MFGASFVLMGATIFGAQGAYTDNPPAWSSLTTSMYVGLGKPAWTIGLALMCYLLFLGEGGVLKMFLECHAFTVLSRLTYCTYLVHIILIYWITAEFIGPVHYTDEWLVLMYVGFLGSGGAVATVLHLLVSTGRHVPLITILRIVAIEVPQNHGVPLGNGMPDCLLVCGHYLLSGVLQVERPIRNLVGLGRHRDKSRGKANQQDMGQAAGPGGEVTMTPMQQEGRGLGRDVEKGDDLMGGHLVAHTVRNVN